VKLTYEVIQRMAQMERKNYYSKTKDWVNETISNNHQSAVYYKEMFQEEIITVPIPKGIDPPDWGPYRKFEKNFVALIKNGSIWKYGYNFFVVTPNNKILGDLVFKGWWENFDPNKIPPPTQYVTSATILTGSATNNYYHWLFDVLTRIHLIKMNGFDVDKYIFDKLQWPIQFETLDRLGIPRNKIMQIEDQNFHLKAENLVVASIPELTGSCPKWAVDFIRGTFLENQNIIKTKEFERIYISREDANWRKIANEDEVVNYLSKKGFRKVVLSSLPLMEQIKIFSSARIIVSPNGAQLGNVVFCDPGAIIIELFSQTTDEFFKISHYLKHDYYHVKCKIAENVQQQAFNDGGPPAFLRNDLLVELDKLDHILKIIGI
jgi:Glycosyltransferase 61